MQQRPKQKQKAAATPVKRYRAGQVPANYVDELSDSEEEEEENEQQRQEPKQIPQQQKQQQRQRLPEHQQRQQQAKQAVQFAQREVVTGLKQIEISEKEVATDRRLQRLQQAQNRKDAEGDREGRRRRHTEDEDEDEDEEEQAQLRIRMKQRALQSQEEDTEPISTRGIANEKLDQKGDSEEEDEDEEESSEYETDSEEEEESISRLPKPTFIPRAHRVTVLEQEKQQKEAEEREIRYQQELEERKNQSHDMLAEQLRREKDGDADKDAGEFEDMVDDTDGLDEEAEYEAWKIRELLRIKRDREERIAREREQEELERRRELPEEMRLKEDLERAEESRNREKGQQGFMQKYYHKGAFYQDDESEIFKRDYTAATMDDVRHRDLLPEVMQVKNFGLAGRTKWTHLTAEDTTGDSPWNEHSTKRQKPNGQ